MAVYKPPSLPTSSNFLHHPSTSPITVSYTMIILSHHGTYLGKSDEPSAYEPPSPPTSSIFVHHPSTSPTRASHTMTILSHHAATSSLTYNIIDIQHHCMNVDKDLNFVSFHQDKNYSSGLALSASTTNTDPL